MYASSTSGARILLARHTSTNLQAGLNEVTLLSVEGVCLELLYTAAVRFECKFDVAKQECYKGKASQHLPWQWEPRRRLAGTNDFPTKCPETSYAAAQGKIHVQGKYVLCLHALDL